MPENYIDTLEWLEREINRLSKLVKIMKSSAPTDEKVLLSDARLLVGQASQVERAALAVEEAVNGERS